MSAKLKKPLQHRGKPRVSSEADRKRTEEELEKLRAEVARLTQLNQGLRVMVVKTQEYGKQITDTLNGTLQHLDTLSDDVIALDKEGACHEHLLAMRTFFLEVSGKIRKIREES